MEITHVGTETFHGKEIDIYLGGNIQDFKFWVSADQLEMLFRCCELERIIDKIHDLDDRCLDKHSCSVRDENRNLITLYSSWAILKMAMHSSEAYVSELIGWTFDMRERIEGIVGHVLKFSIADLLEH